MWYRCMAACIYLDTFVCTIVELNAHIFDKNASSYEEQMHTELMYVCTSKQLVEQDKYLHHISYTL